MNEKIKTIHYWEKNTREAMTEENRSTTQNPE